MSDKKCNFYKAYDQKISSKEVNFGGQRTTMVVNKIPYCSHMDAPQELSKEILTTTLNSASALRCGGDDDRCQIVANMIANH